MRRSMGLVLLLVLPLPALAADKPNIIVILADDLGYADLGCQGCEDIPTPNIDSIAAGGVRFTDGYATHPVCSPSRAGLISGMYQHRFGFEHNSGPSRYASPKFGVPRTIPTLGETLKAAGYATAMVGKWHIGFTEGLRPHERGFDYFYGFLSGAHPYLPQRYAEYHEPLFRNGEIVTGEKEYLTDAFARESVDFIERSKERPWFLYLAFNAVHSPLQATSEYEERFPYISDRKRKIYAGMLAAMDDAVGRVMAKVRELGQEENTLVIFYSDNGGPTPETTSRNDPLRGGKGQMFEGGIRAPFAMQWKGVVPAGQTYREIVMGFDCHATALAAAGINRGASSQLAEPRSQQAASPPHLDGVNLIPFVTGKAEGRPHEELFWRAGPKHAARVGDWKLVEEPAQGGTMLFNLKDDIGEQNDLAASNPAKLKELQAAFAAWEKGTQSAKWIRQDRRNAEIGGKLKPHAATASRRGTSRIDVAFRAADKNGDGKLSRDEYPRKELFNAVDGNKDGFATLEEVRAYYRNRRAPTARKANPREAAAFFRRTEVPGLTEAEAGTNGFALADLNRDGWIDYLAVQSKPANSLPKSPRGRPIRDDDRLRVLLNREGKRFEEHPLRLDSERFSYGNIRRAAQVPNLVDLNGDGHLDIFLSRSAPVTAGRVRRGQELLGNTLFLSDGAWDRFREIPGTLGAANDKAYNRQTAFGDVDGNGWLDLAIGCDNIGDTMGGFPHSRLYLFRPVDKSFAGGRFEDIGGTDSLPDFGDWHGDPSKDKAGPDIQFADLDNDGDLDLLQSCHVDIRDPHSEYSPAEYRQGIWCWKNLLKETGEARFEKITGNGLAVEGRLRWSEKERQLVPESKAPGLPYLALADVDNDGLLDVLAIGPSDPGWAPRAEDVGGRFWRNLGGFRFEEATRAAGLEPLNWSHRQWYEFHGLEIPERLANWKPFYGPNYEHQPGRKKISPMDERPYWADVVFGDFDNDGWQDFVAMDRRDGTTGREGRSVLYHNQGNGTFRPLPQSISGIDAKGISGEAADLNNDGRLDLVFAADPDNSGGWRLQGAPERYRDKVFLGTGEPGGNNHWLRLRFSGVSHHELAGARVTATTGDRTQLRTIFSAHTYKSGGPMEAHFGLGKQAKADVEVTLPSGKTATFAGVKADQFLDLNLKTSQSTQVRKETKP